jgi:ribonuclease HI
MTITAAADGSALGNPGPAGWAWYIDDGTWHAGGWPHGTNNMGELKAVLDLLESTAADPDAAREPLHVLCDSQYVINSLTKWMPGWKRKGWKKRDGKPVQNVELMKALDAALAGRDVRFEWVKGHAGHSMNEAADRRANAAATAFQRKVAPDEGPGFHGVSGGTATEPEVAADPADPADDVIARELALLTDAVRSDLSLADRLLHPDMVAVDSAGRVRSRAEVLETMAPLDGFDAVDEVAPADVAASRVAPEVFLVTYVTSGAAGSVRRTSAWISVDGQWLLRHHQQTPRQ